MSHIFGDSLDTLFFDQRDRKQKTPLFPVGPSKINSVPAPPSNDVFDDDVALMQLFQEDEIVPPTQRRTENTQLQWPSMAKTKSNTDGQQGITPLFMVSQTTAKPSQSCSQTIFPVQSQRRKPLFQTPLQRSSVQTFPRKETDGFSNKVVFGSQPLRNSQDNDTGTSTVNKRTPTIGIPARYQRSSRPPDIPSTPSNNNFSQGDTLNTPGVLSFQARTPGGSANGPENKLRPITEIGQQWRGIFDFPYFNIVQSRVIDDVLYTDKPVVVCAPTGSGKTVIFELAIIRLLMSKDIGFKPKVVYMAPIKALCSEKCDEWKRKFGPLGLKCQELTGDTEMDNIFELQTVDIIMTTPEKWDSMTRRWRDNRSLVQQVKLFLIDEIHILNDESRGPTMEAVVSRMKTVQESIKKESPLVMRFLAISATIPNIDDVAEWLSTDAKAVHYKLDDSYRPVKLRKVVLGFPCSETQSEFKFDITLNYRLAGVIQTYSDQKPTLVFCTTRKSAQQGAAILVKDAKFIMNAQHKQRMQSYANRMRDTKLRDLIMYGVGYHHAGLEMQDRKSVEQMFLAGDLPVLLSTSTLSMGVNLPAHLVVIKSTQHYVMGVYQEYSETQVLQMIGRAGRPQFDTSATAVIMTKIRTKNKYEDLLSGNQMIESSLHTHLIENLNAEVVLRTVTDVTVALEWIKSTFLYIRVMKNPKHYGLSNGLTTEEVERKLQDWCFRGLNELQSLKLIEMSEDCDTKPTEAGRLMARYCITYDTMKLFAALKGRESMNDMILMISKCKEFSDVKLRVNERKALNTMNKDKNRTTIRYSMEGKIKTMEMKVNCLIQAQLGCLSVQDFTLNQDMNKIFRAGQRVTKCLMEYLWQQNNFKSLLTAVLLAKCFKAKLWENSRYVAKQLEGIGPALSTALVNASIDNFQKIDETNPRQLEMIMNRHPPFGNTVKSAVDNLPRYELSIEQVSRYSNNKAELVIAVCLANSEQLASSPTAGLNHICSLIIGDSDNKVVSKIKLSDSTLLNAGKWSKKLDVFRASRGEQLSINMISDSWVGIDVQSTYTPFYVGTKHITAQGVRQTENEELETQQNTQMNQSSGNTQDNQGGKAMMPPNCRPCAHKCTNKRTCAHDCCKFGIPIKRVKKSACKMIEFDDAISRKNSATASHLEVLKGKRNALPPQSPALKRLKKTSEPNTPSCSLSQYAYTPKQKMSPCRSNTPKQTCAPTPTAKGWDVLSLYQNKRNMEGNYSFDEEVYIDSQSSSSPQDVFAVEDYQNFGYCDEELPTITPPSKRSKQNSVLRPSQSRNPYMIDNNNGNKVREERIGTPQDGLTRMPYGRAPTPSLQPLRSYPDMKGTSQDGLARMPYGRAPKTPQSQPLRCYPELKLGESNIAGTNQSDNRNFLTSALKSPFTKSRGYQENEMRFKGGTIRNSSPSLHSPCSAVSVSNTTPSFINGMNTERKRKFTFSRDKLNGRSVPQDNPGDVINKRALSNDTSTRCQVTESNTNQQVSPNFSSEDDDILCNYLSTQEDMQYNIHPVTQNTEARRINDAIGNTSALATEQKQSNFSRPPLLSQDMFVSNRNQDEMDEDESAFDSIFDGIF